MTQTVLQTEAAVEYAVLVTMTWGTSNVVRYCNRDRDVTVAGNVFTAQPTMEVRADQPLHGGTDDSPMEIRVKDSISPVDQLIKPLPHAKVSVTIQEVIPGTDSTLQTLFKGTVGKVKANSRRRGGVVSIKVNSPKIRLNTLVGAQALSTCSWVFGDSHCGFDTATNTLTGTIMELKTNSTINRITIQFNEEVTPDVRQWRRGYVEVDGLRIGIRELFVDDLFRATEDGDDRITEDDDTRLLGAGVSVRLELREVAPASWLAASCSIVPGCDKQIATCQFHDRESQFGGFGIAMPDRNPVFEI